MSMSKEEFKRRWESGDDGGGITNDDCAECYVAWGLGTCPKIRPVRSVVNAVVEAAGCKVEPDPELKNCPCCDGKAELKTDDYFIVRCTECGLQVEEEDLETAVTKWNKRVKDDELEHCLGEMDKAAGIFDHWIFPAMRDWLKRNGYKTQNWGTADEEKGGEA